MSLKFDWKNLENLEICVPNLCVCSLSCGQVFVTSWTVAHWGPLFMEFFRQEYCSRLPVPTPEDLPYKGIEPMSFASPALAGKCFPLRHLGSP